MFNFRHQKSLRENRVRCFPSEICQTTETLLKNSVNPKGLAQRKGAL